MVTRYLCYPGGKTKALTFSYDDGIEQDIRLTEIFKNHNLKATFNINSAYLTDANAPPHRHRHLTAEEALKVYDHDYFEVACHGVCHETLTNCDTASACLEVLNDRVLLEKLFGRQIHGMAYANGAFNDTVVDILKLSGIRYSRTVVSTLKFTFPSDWLRLPATCHHNNPQLMELADKYINMKPSLPCTVFYVWGHAYEFDDNNNWEVIEGFADKMANREDIWYCTNMELYQAWLDYQRLESTADGSQIYNPSVRSVWVMDRKKRVYEILPNQTVTLL